MGDFYSVAVPRSVCVVRMVRSVQAWVSYHGGSLNVAPNLDHYQGIVSCGVRDQGVTSLANLGVAATMDEVDGVMREEFNKLFIPRRDNRDP